MHSESRSLSTFHKGRRLLFCYMEDACLILAILSRYCLENIRRGGRRQLNDVKRQAVRHASKKE